MKRIIIVDDKEQDRYLLKVLLEHTGYIVEPASNGIEALVFARKSPPDCIISDILMPQMDGFMLCREWRNDPALQKLPFIFYTATYTDPRDERFALDLGADRFIVKPTEPVELIDAIKDVLSSSSSSNTTRDTALDNTSESYFKNYSEVLVRKLEDKLELFTAIFETDPDAIFILSTNFTIQNINQAAEKILNRKADELLDTRFVESVILSADQRKLFDERLHSIIIYGKFVDFKFPLVHKDGSKRFMSWNARIINRSNGLLASVLLIGKDISNQIAAEQRKEELERQLLQAQRMEVAGRLSGGIAHDFNNFLSAIMGFTDLLQSDLDLLPEQAEYLKQIRICSDRAAGLTRQLLAFSKQQVLEPKIIDLNAIINGLEPMLRRLTGENIMLVTNLEKNLFPVKADPGRIEQVIMNLTVNSRDAMPSGGTLTISTRNSGNPMDLNPQLPADDYCIVTVTDSGCGMDETTMARMFEPFFTTKEPGKGTGLGLATVYGIVKQSSGYIFCSSKVGEGTSFTIYFPKTSGTIESVMSTESRVLSKECRETILVVEDDPTIRLVTTTLLKYAGYSVLSAANSNEAQTVARQYSGPIHLLLTDMIMPGDSGKVLSSHLCQHYPDMKTLFTSGYTSEIVDSNFSDETHFLSKPFNKKILLEKVHLVLNS